MTEQVKKNSSFKAYLLEVPYFSVLLICLTLGLLPFNPPHVWEKLQMLFSGTLIKPIDWFDLLMHGTPWVLLMTKFVFEMQKKRAQSKSGPN